MNNKAFLEYAENQGLAPLIWFDISYPTFAVKVKYNYPTSNPADFRDRALLQLIDLGMSYATACSILMVNDPHQTILERFKSDTPGPQLIHFDKTLNRLALTPMGRQKVDRIEFAKDGIACCFIDGFSGKPFPIDVVNGLSDRFNCSDVKRNPGGLYPFDPNVEQRLAELNAKLNDSRGRKYAFRLGIPEKSKETSMSLLAFKWMRSLSIGIFLDEHKVVRKIFCDNSASPVSPFGWLENLNAFKLTGDKRNQRFSYVKEDESNTNVFTQVLASSSSLRQLYECTIEKEYGEEFLQNLNLSVDTETGQCSIVIQHLDATTRNRSKILSFIEKGIMPIPLPGLVGTAFVKVQATSEINNLGQLRNAINQSNVNWYQIIERLQNEYPDKWRQNLIAIDRHDLLFKHDVENYIKYGK